MNQFHLTLSLLISVGLIHSALTQEDTGITEGSNSHHGRHRHRHRHRNNEGMTILSDSDTEGDEDSNNNFVAAYRTTVAPEQGDQEGDNGNQNTGSSSMESRLANLEQDVRHLCMEDEEDVERQIRALGVKCVCPKTEAPVCGSDNVTYYNRCYLHCRAQVAETSYHRYKITLKKFGRC